MAQEPLMPYQEHEKKIRSSQQVAPLTSDLFGDAISLYSGATEFSVVDVDLPGNNTLPVQIKRRFKIEPRSDLENFGGFGVWDLDIPYIHGNFDGQVKWNEWSTSVPDARRCTPANWGPPLPYPPFDVGDLFSGIRIHLPGMGERDLLKPAGRNPHKPTDGASYPYSAQNFTSISCTPATANDYPGEGFIVVTSDGLRYTLNAGRERRGGQLSKFLVLSTGGSLRTRSRTQVFLMASRVEDRHGNWVNYHYSGDRLVTIDASDGRRIDLAYDGDAISQVTAGGRTWRYDYAPVDFGLNLHNRLLTRVTRPDGSTWQYGYEDEDGCTGVGNGCPGMLGPEYHQLDVDIVHDWRCPEPFPAVDKFAFSATHPSGAKGRFQFDFARLHRTGVPDHSCVGKSIPSSPEREYTLQTPDYFDLYSISSKALSGPGVDEQIWRYGFSGPSCRHGADCRASKTTRIWQPDGTVAEQLFGVRYGVNDGKLLEVRTVAADGTLLKSEVTSYVSNEEAKSMPFPDIYGSSHYGPDDPVALYLRPAKQTTITQDGAVFQRTVTVFDAFARPTHVTMASSLDYGRYRRAETIVYHDNTAAWLLGQIKTLTQTEPSPHTVVSHTDYNQADLPERLYRFGWLQQIRSYHADGSVATFQDGNGNVTTLSDWKHGIPQTVRNADGSTQSAVVDDAGWMRALTDENGFTTRYDYDAMGRLARIDHPDADTQAWHPTLSSFSQAGEMEHGLPPGHWRQTVSTGDARQVTYFDAFWRPVIEANYDTADVVHTQRQTLHRYDAMGRRIFQSYPTRGIEAHTDPVVGVSTAYDALGRVVRSEQDSELGTLVSTTQYLHGFQQRVTDPRGQATTTSYMAYEQPYTGWPVSIAHPEGSFTDISRDAFGRPLTLRRRNADSSVSLTRRHVYDNLGRLCKSIAPESAATIVDYDAAGNMAWSAGGLSLTDPTQCNTAQALASGRAVQRRYDAMNRLVDLQFPDGNGNQHWSFWPDGEVHAITTLNDGIAVNNTYAYNKRRLPVSETLEQLGGDDWTIGYGYSPQGHLSEHVYPSGRRIEYAPNALGQPTRAGAYATNVRYLPNGGMAQFVYGNGVVHTLSQSVRGLPERSRDVGMAGAVLDDSYDHDGNGNVAAISDGLPGQRGNRDMQYDGLNRLTSATSPMFDAARYHYDALDNLQAIQIAGRDHAYHYDASNRLTNVMQAVDGATVVGLGYDEQGNLANRNGAPFHFDLGNRLRESAAQERYRYDGHGRRILADHPQLGPIASMYGRDGVLRAQHNTRHARAIDYILLNGSQVAQVESLITAAAPSIELPGYSTDGTYLVKWSSAVGAATYELEESAGTVSWQSVYAGALREHAVTGKTPGSYGYRARSCNAAGCGRWGAVAAIFVTKPPAAPSAVTVPAVGAGGQYRIAWQAPMPRETGPTQYTLQESFSSGGWSEAYSGNELGANFDSRPEGEYRYRVNACNPYGCSAYIDGANPIQVVYPPRTPEGLIGPAESLTGSYALQWSASAGATHYRLEEAFNGGGWIDIHNEASTEVTLGGRQTGTYDYRAVACNGVGCSAPSAPHPVAVTVIPPVAPHVSAPASNTTGSYEVSWSGVEHASIYQLVEHRNGASTVIAEVAGGSHAVAERESGQWGYTVRACNRAGCGPDSAPAVVQVLRIPAIPWIGSSTKYQTNHPPIRIACNVWWTAVPNADTYQLHPYSNGQIYQSQYDGPLTSVGSTVPNNNRLWPCSDWHVLRACNAAGCSAWSEPTAQGLSIIEVDPGSGIPIRLRPTP